MPLVNARQGVLGQVVKIKEATPDTDPVTPANVIVPLAEAETVSNTQPLNPARIGDGRRTGKGSWLGMIDASGDLPVSLDYNFVGLDLDCHLGHDVYSRVTVGAKSTHRWRGFGSPTSFQLEKRHTQATALFHRHKAMWSTILAFRPQPAGQAMYTLSHLGVGSFVRTASGGADVDYAPFQAFNYFNGYLNLSDVALYDIIGFALMLDNKITRKDAYFQQGKAAAINFGVPTVEGDLGRIFSVTMGDTFLDLAINETVVPIDCAYTNNPLDTGPTSWLRFIVPACKFSRKEPAIKLDDSEDQSQHFVAQTPTADRWAEVIGNSVVSSTGTFTVPGATSAVVKIDGAAALTIAITAGAQTLATIVGLLNADAGFTAVAVAAAWNGHLLVHSKSVVAAVSKVEFTVAGAAFNTLMGFDTTIHTGQLAAMLYTELVNTKVTDY